MTNAGGKIIRDGLILGYDADDRSSRFYLGEPTTNLATSVSPTWNVWGGMTGTSTSYISASGRMGGKINNYKKINKLCLKIEDF